MNWWQIKKRDADLERELRSDLELEEEEQREGGISEEEARHAALRAFGNPTLIREQTLAVWSWNWLESLARDLRFSLRTLRRSPGFTVIAVLVMALGIGANVALFTVVRGVLLKPLPFHDPDRLMMLYEAGLHEDDTPLFNPVSGGMYAEWKEQNRSYSSLALAQGIRVGLSGSGGQLPEKLNSALISWDLLRTLGVQPALGRDFAQSDDNPAAKRHGVAELGSVEASLRRRPCHPEHDDRSGRHAVHRHRRDACLVRFSRPVHATMDTGVPRQARRDDDLVQQSSVSRCRAAEAGSQRVARRCRSERHLPAHPQRAPR